MNAAAGRAGRFVGTERLATGTPVLTVFGVPATVDHDGGGELVHVRFRSGRVRGIRRPNLRYANTEET